MKTQVFAHKGVIGIKSNETVEGIELLPQGYMPFIGVNLSQVEFQQEAIDLIKTIRKGDDVMGDIATIKKEDGTILFVWFGTYGKVFTPETSVTGKDFDPELLVATAGLETDQAFIDFVEEAM